jgi:hypothetical protein
VINRDYAYQIDKRKDCYLTRGLVIKEWPHVTVNKIVNREKRGAIYHKIKSVTTRDGECNRVKKVCTRDSV